MNMKPMRVCSGILMATFLASTPGFTAEGKAKKNGDDLFLLPQIVSLKIDIPASGLDALKQDHKEYVKATVAEGGRVLSNVGVRYKGSVLFGAAEGRPSFTIKFNEFVSGQKSHGLTKIVLDACPNDPSCLSSVLANELYRAAGVPAPRDAFAHVTVNGKDLGLFVLVEGINRDFLGQHFDKAKGNLYEGDSHDIVAKLDKDSGDDFKDQADVDALAKAAQETDPAQRWQKLEKALDVDRFIAFLAIETLTWQTNGYSMRTNKYRLYHDPTSDKMVFLPHGTEPAFVAVDGPLFPAAAGLIARTVLQAPEGKKLYREQVTKLLNTHFRVETIQARLAELAAKVRPVVAQNNPAAATAFDAAVKQLGDRIARRAYFVQQEIRKS
jgi:hypothetical protein